MELLEGMMNLSIGILIVIALVVLAIIITVYVVMGIYLNRLNDVENGRKTCFAWIPVLNVYLLGKLAVNKFVGWLMVLAPLLMGTSSVTVNGETTTYTLLPEPFNTIYSTIYGVVFLTLLIVVIVKYNKRKFI